MPEPSQADIFAALAAQSASSSRRARPSTLPYDALSTDQLIEPSTSGFGAGADSGGRNKRRVYCFREGCACLILLPGAGEVIQAEEPILPEDPSSPFPPTSSPSSSLTNLYLRIPTAFDFENVGYSRPASGDASTLIPSSAPGLDSAPAAPSPAGATAAIADAPATETASSEGAREESGGSGKAIGGKGAGVKVKWLICADCDLGPIGWGYEGGTEAYLDMRRCRYAAE